MKRVRFADVTEEEGRPVFPKTHRRRTLLPGPEQDDDDLEGELTEGYRGAADVEDLLDDGCGEEQGPIKRTNPLFSAANRAARRKERAKLASVQNGSFLEDVASAEVNYAVHSQNWDNSGVPLEPFNLKHERETGYFDDDGNYIAYCDAEPDDAWLESLPAGPEVDQADEEENDGQGRQASNDDLEPHLSADTLRGYKEGIVDLLLPGESVFGALRRLAGLEGRKRVSELRKDPGAGSVNARPFLKGRTVPPENRNAFDRLTTLSNALLVNGDYHVHANSREVLQADLLQHASGVPSKDHPNTAAPEQPAASSSAAVTPQSTRDVHGWRAFAARLSAPSSAASAQDRSEAQATDGTAVAAPVDPEEDIFEDAQPVARRLAECGGGGMKADGVVPAEPDQAQSAAAGTEDSACGTPMDETEGQCDSPLLGSLSGQRSCASSSAQSVDAETVTAVACGRQPSPSCASQDTNMVFAEPASAASGDSLPMEGFEYDADSGYYYNSLLGAYYDPDNRLFGDAASGHWFSLQNGEYQIVVRLE